MPEKTIAALPTRNIEENARTISRVGDVAVDGNGLTPSCLDPNRTSSY